MTLGNTKRKEEGLSISAWISTSFFCETVIGVFTLFFRISKVLMEVLKFLKRKASTFMSSKHYRNWLAEALMGKQLCPFKLKKKKESFLINALKDKIFHKISFLGRNNRNCSLCWNCWNPALRSEKSTNHTPYLRSNWKVAVRTAQT